MLISACRLQVLLFVVCAILGKYQRAKDTEMGNHENSKRKHSSYLCSYSKIPSNLDKAYYVVETVMFHSVVSVY